MPVRQTAPVGAPCWIDLQTSDPQRARTFYCDLLGWTALAENAEFGGYWMWNRGDAPVAGGMPADAQAPVTNVWSVYLAVPDAAKSLQVAAEHGAQIVVQAMPVADLGTMGFLLDPTGAGIGVWQAGTFHGFTVLAEHGTPGWFEVHTRDYPTDVAFYRDVFGWTVQAADTEHFRYTMMIDPSGPEGMNMLAGVMDATGLPGDIPPHWQLYFAVDDTDAAVKRVGELGGSVLQPAQDTPYGRIAIVGDPMGAVFSLVGPGEAMPAR
jgi:uncharacterized protein